jgi:D-aspartate ligase
MSASTSGFFAARETGAQQATPDEGVFALVLERSVRFPMTEFRANYVRDVPARENETPRSGVRSTDGGPSAPSGNGSFASMPSAARSGSARTSPAMLANGDFYGTLAAARCLGEIGAPVYLLDARPLGITRWSRHTARALKSPPLTEPVRFLDWLSAYGEREPGIVLYPTSDEATFLYALRRDELSRHYRMYQPDISAIVNVLDKKHLYATAQKVGMAIPDTWFPETDEDVQRIAREAPMPLLVKPRTQVLSYWHSKGIIVDKPSDLSAKYWEFVRTSRYDALALKHIPEAPKAMLQRYLPEAAEQIYVLAAFVDRTGEHFAARSAMKVFQRPRRLGIGLCFEESPLDPELAEAARRLAIASGYYGLFQLEFIKQDGRFMLIDFNPRYYNQLAFDVARGLPLPQVIHAAAHGDDAEVARLIDGAKTQHHHDGMIFCNRFGFSMMLSTQRLAGRISATEASRWKQWYEAHQAKSIDPAIAAGDRLPGIIDVASQVYAYARHPRYFLRKIVLDRTA